MIARRGLMLGGAALMLPLAARAAVPANGRLAFQITRNGDAIGTHVLDFSRQGELLTVTIKVRIAVKFGPITVFRYEMDGREQWQGETFATLETETNDDGDKLRLRARRGDAGLRIEGKGAPHTMPAQALPLTHWNISQMGAPLFNPQDGKVMELTVAPGRAEAGQKRFLLRGDAEIDDIYAADGTWYALSSKAKDGSTVIYQRQG